MPEIADVFRRHGQAYIEKYGQTMPQSHLRAMADIMNCRTEALGGHVFVCRECEQTTYSYHSCKNRACPKCHTNDTDIWLEKRKQDILPTPYFHVTNTLPEGWRNIVRANQKDLYSILMKAAAKAIGKLAADKKYVGGQVGIMAVLHTWTRTMVYHPHVHCLVTGGGVSKGGQHWHSSPDGYLFPKRALSKLFRGIFIDMVRKIRPDIEIPKATTSAKWVAHVKDAGHGTEAVLAYLARYVHRTAIVNSRILDVNDERVTFTYRDNRDQRRKSISLDPEEFIRRFLQHIPPKGFHRVRYYGLWSTAKQSLLKDIQRTMTLSTPPEEIPGQKEPQNVNDEKGMHPMEGRICPLCKKGTLNWAGTVTPNRVKPP